MIEKKIAGLLFIAIVFLLFSCSTLKVERPPESYQETTFYPPVSDICIPFEVDLLKIERIINQQFRGLIYADTSFEDNDNDNLMIKAWKKDDIELTMEGNQLLYRVPVSVWMRKKFIIGAFGLGVSDIREVTGDILLKFRTRITLNKDWSISASTVSNGYEWLTTPVVKIGGVSLPLPVISDLLMDANQKDINTQIDKALRTALDLKSNVLQVWEAIQVPIKISDEYPLWAKITPLEIRTVPLIGASGKINHTISIKAITEIVYGDEPEYQVNENLPELKITSRLDNDFTISLPVDVSYQLLMEIARQQLVGFQYRQGRYVVNIKDLFLFGAGDKLVVAASIDGSLKGTIYFSGEPYYDNADSSLALHNLDFDVRTKNILVRSGAWIFHSGLVNALETKLRYPVGDQISLIRKNVQSYLSENKKTSYFRVSGNLDKLDPGKILITPGSIKVFLLLSGKLNLSFEEE